MEVSTGNCVTAPETSENQVPAVVSGQSFSPNVAGLPRTSSCDREGTGVVSQAPVTLTPTSAETTVSEESERKVRNRKLETAYLRDFLERLYGPGFNQTDSKIDSNADTLASSYTHLPDIDQNKIKILEYFITFRENSLSDQIHEIANIINESVVCHSYYYSTYVEIGYTVGFCKVAVMGMDDESCEEQCEIEIIRMFQKWCGYNDFATNDDDDIDKIDCVNNEIHDTEGLIDDDYKNLSDDNNLSDSLSDQNTKPSGWVSWNDIVEQYEAGMTKEEEEGKTTEKIHFEEKYTESINLAKLGNWLQAYVENLQHLNNDDNYEKDDSDENNQQDDITKIIEILDDNNEQVKNDPATLVNQKCCKGPESLVDELCDVPPNDHEQQMSIIEPDAVVSCDLQLFSQDDAQEVVASLSARRLTVFSRFRRWVGKRLRAAVVCFSCNSQRDQDNL